MVEAINADLEKNWAVVSKQFKPFSDVKIILTHIMP